MNPSQNNFTKQHTKMAKNLEYRNIQNQIRRADNESRLVEGVAVVFNTESSDMGYIETISREAITEEVIRNSDIFATLDHDKGRGILARSRYGKGTLSLELREDGLHYSFEAPNTQLGNELLEYLSRGEITSSSFAFVVDANDGDEWFRTSDGTLHRNIKKIYRLYDVSPVFEPAYKETDCTRRKLDEIANVTEKLNGLSVEFENL